MNMKITTTQVETAYNIACQVFEQKLTLTNAANLLEKVHGLNPNSAKDFIYNYRHLVLGEPFKRSLSAPSMDYFLTRIEADQGRAALELALTALWGHIHYLEGIRRKRSKNITSGELTSMRSVATKHESFSHVPKSFEEVTSQFNIALTRSLLESGAVRRKRLESATKIPKKIQVSADIFLRNSDVVAEVFDRANGICEQCNKPAPFNRKSNGSPYLEVHHKLQLAKGGEDSVENAIALCPNCHRQFHFGATFNL